MKSILLSCLTVLLISCGTTQGIRITADSIIVGKVNGIGEDTASESSSIVATNQVSSVTITNSSTGKNQSNTVDKVTKGVLTLGAIKVGGRVVEKGIDATADVVSDFAQ